MAAPAVQLLDRCSPSPSPQSGGTRFKPSPEQRKFRQALQTEEPAASVRDFCERVGVSPTSVYRWQRNPAFRRWIAADLANHLFMNAALLAITASNASVNGDQKMAMAMLKFSFHPNGLAAFNHYLTHPPNAPADDDTDPDDDSCADPEPPPPPVGAMSATYRLLQNVKHATEAHYLSARRAVLFHDCMEQLARYAAAEEEAAQHRAAAARPEDAAAPILAGPPAAPPQPFSAAGGRLSAVDGPASRAADSEQQVVDQARRPDEGGDGEQRSGAGGGDGKERVGIDGGHVVGPHPGLGFEHRAAGG